MRHAPVAAARVVFAPSVAAAVTRVLKRGTGELEVVLTGRNPSEDIVSHADYLTEMVCKKHPFEQGIPSREGVEY